VEVLKSALELLTKEGALTGREIAQRLSSGKELVDRRLVNSVLSREGARFLVHDGASGKYTVKQA
jgi:hypothetical protein